MKDSDVFTKSLFANNIFKRVLSSPEALPTFALVRLLEAKGLITMDEFMESYNRECNYFLEACLRIEESSDLT